MANALAYPKFTVIARKEPLQAGQIKPQRTIFKKFGLSLILRPPGKLPERFLYFRHGVQRLIVRSLTDRI